MFVSVGSASNVGEDLGKLDAAALRKWEADKPRGRGLGQRERPRRRAGVRSAGQGTANFRHRHPQLRRPGRQSRPPAICGARPTSATGSATTCRPTTSRACAKAASTAGPGTTWAAHEDPRHNGERPDLAGQDHRPGRADPAPFGLAAIDVLQPATSFPPTTSGSVFAAEHGSWNRATRTGYKIIRAIAERRRADRRIRGLRHRLRDRRHIGLGPAGRGRAGARTARSSSPRTATARSGASAEPRKANRDSE